MRLRELPGAVRHACRRALATGCTFSVRDVSIDWFWLTRTPLFSFATTGTAGRPTTSSGFS